MRKEIDNIEIQEPPIQELKKNRSCLRQSCVTGCGCFTVGIVIFFIVLHFTAAPRPKELKNLPENFPITIPVYDQENVEKMTFTSGQEKNRNLEWLTYVPKAILIPIYLVTQDYLPEEFRSPNKVADQTESWWQTYWRLVKRPITKQKDTFEIEWRNLPADPQFVQDYYTTELKKNNYEVIVATENQTIRQLTFSQNDIEGVMYIKDDNKTTGTDQAILTVTVPK
jgi:hypothetical protein